MRIDTAKKEVSLEKTTKEQIGEAIGEASMCWEPTPTGVFDSTKAAAIVDRIEALVTREKVRLLELLLKETPWSVERYKATVKHTGGLLTASMAVAYEKGLQDAFKILGKEKGT